ncbi:MAG: nucleotidyltransferase domain-containing protein [Candidatus Pacearchaeota archaeon]|nr:nucleotidyltransferase domain-containing protein [Candidatus Pacearchaeota archaeon]
MAILKIPKPSKRSIPSLNLKEDNDIAFDFATKAYEKFGKIVKSIVLFGSIAKKKPTKNSDIDLILIVDDCSVQWDQELIAWYRQELGKLIMSNPYSRPLHVNTVKLSTWWQEMMRGEPVIINIIRYGIPIIDFGGFFTPLKVLLSQGKIKSTPESVYIMLQRAPLHLARTRMALLGSIEGMYWAMVDSSHAALIAAKQIPPSPEQIPELLRETFVKNKMLDSKFISWYEEIYTVAHEVFHGERKTVKASDIETWQQRTDQFLGEMAKLISKVIS